MDYDKIMDSDFTDAALNFQMTRRRFLQVIGGGIVIMFAGGEVLGQQHGGRNAAQDFNAFLRIGEDGKVTCFVGKIEMGQGAITSLAQELADELDVPLESVTMVMGDTDLCPYDAGTWGSLTTRSFGPHLRAAGAEAREVLLELASEQLATPVEDLIVENGIVYNKNRRKKASYAELTKGQQITRRAKAPTAPKSPANLKVVGTSVARRDAHLKVTGAAKYAADIHPDGMLCAKILRPPAHGATLKSVDVSGVNEVKGAQVVREGDFIAVLHVHPGQAELGLSKIKAEFVTPSSDVDDVSIFDHLLKVANSGEDVARSGDLKKGEARASSVFDTTYLNSYVAHSPIEPHSAVAQIVGKKTTVWASTQSPFGVREEIAKLLGCPKEDVRVIAPFIGGGFGGKSIALQAIDAVRLAKLTGKPIQVAWTRAEEFFDDTFRPAAVVKIRSGITENGGIAFWDYHEYYAGARGAEHFYKIPDSATVSHGGDAHPFATGPWRAPGNNTNTFARESQIDMMAAKAGIDPVKFRLDNLREEKFRGVLTAVAKKFGWTSSKLAPGRGCGVALGTDAGTFVATMAEVEVDVKTGAVQVKRVVTAQDMGLVVNPEGAKIQLEGGITMGLGYALTEEIHFKGGNIIDRNFDTYQLPRFSWLPEIETVSVENKSEASQGGGEPGIITMGAVIANAICAATGARLLQLPMTRSRVLEALSKK